MSLLAEDTQWITENFPEHLGAFKELSEVTEATPVPEVTEATSVPEVGELATDERLSMPFILVTQGGKFGVSWGRCVGIGLGPKSGKGAFLAPPLPKDLIGQVWTLTIKGGSLTAKGPTSAFAAKGNQEGLDGTWSVKFFAKS